MEVSLKARVNWGDKDIAGLSGRLTNGRRELSIAMLGWPTHQNDGPICTTVETVKPSLALFAMDGDGNRTEVTEAVLGSEYGDEYYPEKYLKQALKWLMEA